MQEPANIQVFVANQKCSHIAREIWDKLPLDIKQYLQQNKGKVQGKQYNKSPNESKSSSSNSSACKANVHDQGVFVPDNPNDDYRESRDNQYCNSTTHNDIELVCHLHSDDKYNIKQLEVNRMACKSPHPGNIQRVLTSSTKPKKKLNLNRNKQTEQ